MEIAGCFVQTQLVQPGSLCRTHAMSNKVFLLSRYDISRKQEKKNKYIFFINGFNTFKVKNSSKMK